MTGLAFGMLANNPFFGGCFGFGMYPTYNRVDFGGFANPFPSVFSGVGYYGGVSAQLPPTTFANQNFPIVDFSWIGQTVWDTYTNPDSEYNKQLMNYFEQINKQYEENQKKSNNNNNNYSFLMPFYQAQMMVNPWQFIQIPGITSNNTNKSVDLEPDIKDSETKKENNSVISYDAQKLKNKWSKKQPQLPDKFYSRVVEISQKVKCNPEHLMAVMNLETRKTFSTSEKNPNSSATGLIQFTYDTAIGLGTTIDKLKAMTPVEQLDYVEKYLVENKKSAGYKDNETLDKGTLYSLVFLPGRSKRKVLTSKGEKYYEQNKILDYNKDGNITKADLAKKLNEFMA